MDDEETRQQMRKAIENTAISVTGVLKVKKKAKLLSSDTKEDDIKDTPIEEDCKQFPLCPSTPDLHFFHDSSINLINTLHKTQKYCCY